MTKTYLTPNPLASSSAFFNVCVSKKGLVKLDREITDKIRSKDKFKVKVVDNNNNLKMSLIFYSIKELLSELENIIKINGK